jgi:high-affinity iron transporter
MLATALIVFREVFEVSLVVGIVLAATRGILGRGLWVTAGIGAGLAGSVLIALSAGTIAAAAQGMGEELLNAAVLGVAVVMLGWHNVWMSRHGQELAREMDSVGHAVAAGARPPYALAVVVGLAMLREGSEIVLFLWGVAASDSSPLAGMIAGGAVGLAGGCLVGLALYLGLLRIPQRHIFTVTSWMIVLLAAGMAAQAAGFLRQMNAVPALGETLWDTSAFIADRSLAGRVLHALIGYTARPDGIQVLAFLLTLAAITALMRWLGAPKAPPAALTAIAVVAGFAFLYPVQTAEASRKVFMPLIVAGEAEVELRGHEDRFKDGPAGGQTTVELGYGVNDHWFTELELEFDRERGTGETEHSATAWENVFAVQQGRYWADFGGFAELEFGQSEDEPNTAFTAGPIAQKQWGATLHTINLFLHSESGGPRADPNVNLLAAWQSRWLLSLPFQPGFEVYAEPGDVTHFRAPSEQVVQAGPVLFGKFILPNRFSVRYEAGVLFGQTRAAPEQTAKWMVEVERVF